MQYADGGKECKRCPGNYHITRDQKGCECVANQEGECETITSRQLMVLSDAAEDFSIKAKPVQKDLKII